jgi:glutamate-1-semialdehyde aminotransferase
MWACAAEEPQPGFLEGVQQMAHEHGALFVLDEVRTGFHLSLGGAQQHFGVTPDLATFGKAMANGFPLSVLTGRAEYMDQIADSWISSTHCTNAFEYAAALATIEYMEEQHVIDHLWDIGSRLIIGLNSTAQDLGVEATMVGLAPMPDLVFRYPDPQVNESAKKVFYEEALCQGVFFHPNHHWFVSAAHGDVELATTLEAAEAGLRAVKRRL